MIQFLRVLAAAAVISAGLLAVLKSAIVPYRCNQQLKLAKRDTVLGLRESQRASAILAQRNLERLADCDAWCQSNVDALMVIAANARILGRYEDAIHRYDQALQIDKRPELLLNRAMAQYEMGDIAAGFDALVAAVQFDFPTLWAIPDPVLRDQVFDRVVPTEFRKRRVQ